MTVAVALDRARHDYVRPDTGAVYTSLIDLSLSIEAGEFFSLVGPSGCGKSTLLNIIAGFEALTAGSAVAFGAPIVRPGPERGVVFQTDAALFPWLTVAENVAYGPKVRGEPRDKVKEKVARFLSLVNLSDHAGKFPRELSGGMRQRCQIARVLANDARLLLMDEPFGAVDAQTRRRLQREFAAIWNETKKTVVFVTHDVGEAVLLGDRVGIMTSGPSARLQEVVPVDLPRPRDTRSLALIDLVDRLTRQLDDVTEQ